jgi:hypothetical protein
MDRHDPWVGRRVLISHEELVLLVVRPSVGVTSTAGGRFFLGVTKVARSKIYLQWLAI